jgi:hypothetical protein
MRKSTPWTALWLGLGLAIAALGPSIAAEIQQFSKDSPPRQSGVVVEEVVPESLGARADLRAGDLLLTWCRTAAPLESSCLSEGKFESPFDFEEMDLEQAPFGGVRVSGKRADASRVWVLLPGSQSVKARICSASGSCRRRRGPLAKLSSGGKRTRSTARRSIRFNFYKQGRSKRRS